MTPSQPADAGKGEVMPAAIDRCTCPPPEAPITLRNVLAQADCVTTSIEDRSRLLTYVDRRIGRLFELADSLGYSIRCYRRRGEPWTYCTTGGRVVVEGQGESPAAAMVAFAVALEDVLCQ